MLVNNNSGDNHPRGSGNNNNHSGRRPKSVAGIVNGGTVSDFNDSNDHDFEDGEAVDNDSVIVPRRGPRPPARKRPKSTPVINITQLMADKKR